MFLNMFSASTFPFSHPHKHPPPPPLPPTTTTALHQPALLPPHMLVPYLNAFMSQSHRPTIICGPQPQPPTPPATATTNVIPLRPTPIVVHRSAPVPVPKVPVRNQKPLFRPWLQQTHSDRHSTQKLLKPKKSQRNVGVQHQKQSRYTRIHNKRVLVVDDECTRQASAMETVATNLGKTLLGHRCIYCGKLYSRKYGLKIHLRTHTGFKPLKCGICKRPFGDPSNLNKHTRLHANSAESDLIGGLELQPEPVGAVPISGNSAVDRNRNNCLLDAGQEMREHKL